MVYRPVKGILIELLLLGFGEHIVQVLDDKFFRTLEAGASQWENSFLHFFLDVVLKAFRVEDVLAAREREYVFFILECLQADLTSEL